MARTRTTSIAAMLAVGLWAGLCARAQVKRTQDGRRLDASFRVGSGRVNTPVNSGGGFGSQLYVNGQVTGLAAFHGRTGYAPSDSLRLGLPSDRLTTFQRQSVGLDAARGGGTFRTGAFYSRSSTVFGAGGILAGRAATGSSIPRTSSGASPLANRLYEEARAAYGPLSVAGLQPFAPLGGPLGAPLTPGLSFRPVPSLPGGALGGLSRPGASSLFAPLAGAGAGLNDPYAIRQGVDPDPGQENPPNPALSPSSLTPPSSARPDAAPPGLAPAGPAGGGSLTPEPTDQAAGPGATPGGLLPPTTPALGPGTSSPDSPSALAGRMKMSPATGSLQGAALKSPSRPGRLPGPGQDVFVDLLVALKERRAASAPSDPARLGSAKPIPILGPRRPRAGGAEPPADPTALSVDDWRTGRKRLTYRQSEPGEEPAAGAAEFVELSADQKIRLNALAGGGKDQFNLRMGSAQEKLRAGRYYDAAADFEAASQLDPKNPLARVGGGLALFCAGEPLTAANYLRRAMGEFPPLMDARITLRRIAPANALRWQLERLRKRLESPAEARQPLMVFLAAFLYLNLDQPTVARQYAATLKEISANDPLLQAYAARLLTQSAPATQPAPR